MQDSRSNNSYIFYIRSKTIRQRKKNKAFLRTVSLILSARFYYIHVDLYEKLPLTVVQKSRVLEFGIFAIFAPQLGVISRRNRHMHHIYTHTYTFPE